MSQLNISLPMYVTNNLKETARAWEQGISKYITQCLGETSVGIVENPQDLISFWKTDYTVFSQTCGYPYSTRLIEHVNLVATPCYRAPGCSGGFYRSAIVVHKNSSLNSINDLANKTVAVNQPDSFSGAIVWNRILKSPQTYFGDTKLTGAHIHSLESVISGHADCAAIDCVSLALISEHENVTDYRVIAWSPPAPGLPFISNHPDQAKVYRALKLAMSDKELSEVRNKLLISDIELISESRYAPLSGLPIWIESHVSV